MASADSQATVNLSVNINAADGGLVNISVYRESDGYNLINYNNQAVSGEYIEVNDSLLDISSRILNDGDEIYFAANFTNASGTFGIESDLLEFSSPTSNSEILSDANWVDANTSFDLTNSTLSNNVNLTVQASGFPEGSTVNLTIYNVNSLVAVNKYYNVSINADGTVSTAGTALSDIVTGTAVNGDVYYFTATSGSNSVTSGNLTVSQSNQYSVTDCSEVTELKYLQPINLYRSDSNWP